MKHFKIKTNGNTLSNNLTQNCIACFSTCKTVHRTISDCPEYGGKRRQGFKTTSKCEILLCCDKTKTTKLFKEKMESLIYVYPEVNIPIKEIKKSEQSKVNRLVHNLTSINAHNIQEIYDLVPQEVLAKNWKNQLQFIKEEVTNNPEKAAIMFLRIAKHNIHMKSEFSIYRKIEREDSFDLEYRSHPIRKVLLNVLHTFFSDFTKREIYVDVLEFNGKVKIDYETIQVALYHLIENAAKYAKNQSKILISFFERENFIDVIFQMKSAYVPRDERDDIMKEGISGIMAKKMGLNGDGIGMWRINQMMNLNKGEFIAEFGDVVDYIMGFEFSENKFTLRFKKN